MTLRMPTPYLDLTLGGPWPLNEASVHYLRRVRRCQEGDLLVAFDGLGHEIDARLALMDGTWVITALGAPRVGQTGAPISVYYGLPKGEKLDRVTRQLTELGVRMLIPLVTERSIVRLTSERTAKKHSRLCRIASEAARQCGRADTMRIDAPTTLPAALNQIPEGDTVLAFDPSGLLQLDGIAINASVSIFIGPESGFSSTELKVLQERGGAQLVSLGPRVLRTETAAPVCTALTLHKMGHL